MGKLIWDQFREQYNCTGPWQETAIFFLVLTAISVYDIRRYIIPDTLVLAGGVNRLFFMFITMGGAAWSALWIPLIRGLVTGVLVYIISMLCERLTGAETMGGGDIKMLCMTGMYLTVPDSVRALLIACVSGAIYGIFRKFLKRNIRPVFPFGPFIALGVVLVYLDHGKIFFPVV